MGWSTFDNLGVFFRIAVISPDHMCLYCSVPRANLLVLSSFYIFPIRSWISLKPYVCNERYVGKTVVFW